MNDFKHKDAKQALKTNHMDFPLNSTVFKDTPVSKFLSAHSSLKKRMVQAKMNRGLDFLPLWEVPHMH